MFKIKLKIENSKKLWKAPNTSTISYENSFIIGNQERYATKILGFIVDGAQNILKLIIVNQENVLRKFFDVIGHWVQKLLKVIMKNMDDKDSVCIIKIITKILYI